MGNNDGLGWLGGYVLGFALGMLLFWPSASDKEKLRQEGYERARKEYSAMTQPATQPTSQDVIVEANYRTGDKFSGLEME
jgi:hypothetical protein